MRLTPILAALAAIAWVVALAINTRSKADLAFSPPGEALRERSIGSTEGLSTELRRAFHAGAAFDPIEAPGPSDWLAGQREPGQTYDQFIRTPRNRPDGARDTIYLQPLGLFDADERYPTLEQMTEYARAFFAMEVERLPTLPLGAVGETSREHGGRRQWLTGDLLEGLAERVPADAYCVLAITMADLYPDPAWNYVFGMASLRERVGVFSFARHDPAFYLGGRKPGWEALMLERNCKVLTHEIGHMFAITHCIYFQCLMNGSNHLAESDSKPLHLCPCCLRKLHRSVGFDPGARYAKLAGFLSANGLAEQGRWFAERSKVVDAD